jgi:glycosyltransferase involved in cell wall biosynthesis
MMINQADWWFPYTEGVKRIVIDGGFDEKKISVVGNAIDTRLLRQQYEDITVEEIANEKKKLNINSENIGIYCGALYEEKRIEFLLNASERIKEKVNDFHLIIVGAGPDLNIVQEFTKRRDWIHYMGSKFNEERVIYFKMSKLFLLPGAVGLAVLDAFATQTPMFTTDYPFHGPEVEYIRNNKNGMITEDNLDSYVREVSDTLLNDVRYEKLVQGCIDSSLNYTIEKMIDNFSNGIIRCLYNGSNY